MKLRAAISALVVLSCLVAFADDKSDYARKVAELKEKVTRVKEKDRDKTLAELVRNEVELANQEFDAGDRQAAEATVADIKRHISECRQAATTTGKNLKRTEILLRESGRRLDELRRDVDFSEQPSLEEAFDQIQDARTAILDRMFHIKDNHQ